MASADRSAGSCGSARLLSRGDPDELEASAAEPLGVGRSQPVVPGPGGQADPAQALAARPGPLIRDLNLPASSEKYLQRLEAGLSAGLAALAEAVEAGAVAIEGGELRLPRRKPAPKDPRLEPARQALARAFGDVQFPEVLVEVDGLTRFSWILLGRPGQSEQELVTLYAALMGLGSDLSVAELVRMVPASAADSLGQMMLKIAAERRLRSANDAVLGLCANIPSPPYGTRAVCLGRHDEPGGDTLFVVGTARPAAANLCRWHLCSCPRPMGHPL